MNGDGLTLDPNTRERLGRLGDEFLVDFFGHVLEAQPNHLGALWERAQLLTRLGRHRDALAHDRQLARLAPEDDTVVYNLACSLALVGDRDGALDALERAVMLGYSDGAHLAADEDLASLREEPRFRALLERLAR